MIDIQHLMFDTISRGIEAIDPAICVTDVFNEQNAKFPVSRSNRKTASRTGE